MNSFFDTLLSSYYSSGEKLSARHSPRAHTIVYYMQHLRLFQGLWLPQPPLCDKITAASADADFSREVALCQRFSIRTRN